MAITKSGLYVKTFLDQMKQTAETPTTTAGLLNWTLATWKVSLVSSAATDASSPLDFSVGQAWVSTQEVTGSGWVTGGVLLSAAATGSTSVVPTVAEGTAGSMRYNWTNPLSVASTTLVNAAGMIIYADPISAPVAKPMMIFVWFGGAFSTTAGTFGVTPSGTGIYEIDITP